MARTTKQPYRQSRAFDRSCRCHGGCPYCADGKQHFDKKRRTEADEKLREWENDNG